MIRRLFFGISQVILNISMVILGCGKDNLILYTFFKRGEEEIGLPTSTSMSTQDKIFVTFVFLLLPPTSTLTSTSIQNFLF